MFKISARTVLELGAELISSDVIAFYELIKNAFDARSPNGAEIYFEVPLRRNAYLRLRGRAVDSGVDLSRIKADVLGTLDRSAPGDSLNRFRAAVTGAEDTRTLVEALDSAYLAENRIIVCDAGTGMSRRDLVENYLVIGTASRRRALDAALADPDKRNERAPFLGEKGIGRLSAMRLGDRLTVETARRADTRMNLLRIDWSAFGGLDTMLEEIDVAPECGDEKATPDWNGTRLIIGALTADWTHQRVKELGEFHFARLTDPFADAKRRPRIAIFWNGTRIPVAHMDRHLIGHAHASVKGHFTLDKMGPKLECRFEARDLGFEHPHEVEKRVFRQPDLEGAIVGSAEEIPRSALVALGEFEFEAYWFNRRRLGAIDGIGEQNRVRALHKKWSGILLFRDEFRVLPYGENEDDWLALDRSALGSTSYLLNKAQFVGRVAIRRLGNPTLVDQTNREGLRVCPEQRAFIGLLQLAIQDQLRDFLKDVRKRHTDQPLELGEVRTNFSQLEQRARVALTEMERVTPGSATTIEELRQTLLEINETFERAQARMAEMERESRQMIQMAGVGLLVEVVAHELARSTENALAALKALRGRDVPEEIAGLLNALRSEMTAVSKRLRVLDPLSVSGRQRREIFNLGRLVADIVSGHQLQFQRHDVTVSVTMPEQPVRVRAVKGMIVQILENLLSNSLYWLRLRKEHEPALQPRVAIAVDIEPLTISYADNGRGIARENREKVFRAFFSLKEKTKRRGLGLFIARECAAYHGASLTLEDRVDSQTGRLHRFVLQFPDDILA